MMEALKQIEDTELEEIRGGEGGEECEVTDESFNDARGETSQGCRRDQLEPCTQQPP